MTDAEQAALHRAQHALREAYQALLDAALTPASDAPAEAVRADWQPIEDVIKEGPDVGFREEAGSEKDQRIN